MIVVALMHRRPSTLSFITFTLSTNPFTLVVVLIIVGTLITVVMANMMVVVAVSKSRRRWRTRGWYCCGAKCSPRHDTKS